MKILEVSLHEVAHGRAGDKGNFSNISVIPYNPLHWDSLVDQVTEDRVFNVTRHLGVKRVTRHVLPNLNAMNFVLEDALQGGVNASLGLDRHGKTLSFLVLGDIKVLIPTL